MSIVKILQLTTTSRNAANSIIIRSVQCVPSMLDNCISIYLYSFNPIFHYDLIDWLIDWLIAGDKLQTAQCLHQTDLSSNNVLTAITIWLKTVGLTSAIGLETSGQHTNERRLSSPILAQHHNDLRVGEFTGCNVQLEVACNQSECKCGKQLYKDNWVHRTLLQQPTGSRAANEDTIPLSLKCSLALPEMETGENCPCVPEKLSLHVGMISPYLGYAWY